MKNVLFAFSVGGIKFDWGATVFWQQHLIALFYCHWDYFARIGSSAWAHRNDGSLVNLWTWGCVNGLEFRGDDGDGEDDITRVAMGRAQPRIAALLSRVTNGIMCTNEQSKETKQQKQNHHMCVLCSGL